MRETMPWERQIGESHKAFQAFHAYCLLGDSRSIRELSRRLNKSVALLGKWSSKWKWQERVRNYDNYLTQQEIDAAKEEIKEMRKRQIEIGKYFQAKGLDAIKIKVTNEDKLSMEELRDLLSLVTKGMQIETDARLQGLELVAPSTMKEGVGEITNERRRELEEFFNE